MVKAVGDFDYARTDLETPSSFTEGDNDFDDNSNTGNSKGAEGDHQESKDSESPRFTKELIAAYKPKVVDRIWELSEVDLEFIQIGCYILGTGGGGNPYQHFLRLRELHRNGSVLRVMDPRDLKDDAVVACGGGKGSPQVSVEKPYGDE